MLKRYEAIIESYKTWYPSLYEHTVECMPNGYHSILITLDDGVKMEYSAFDNTIRNVTKLYSTTSVSDLNEETWRKEFGHRLRRAMNEKGISQEKVADMIGVSRQMMSRYVRGTSTPSSYVLTRLSEILKYDIRELTKFGYIDED